MKYPKEYLDEIKNRLKVSTVVSKSVSIKRILKNVDALLPIHSLESIENLTFYLARKTRGEIDFLNWRARILDRERELTS